MFIRTSRLQLGNFAINDAKRLLQQYRPITTDIALEPNVGFRGTAEVRVGVDQVTKCQTTTRESEPCRE
jgi:hypothetical protein